MTISRPTAVLIPLLASPAPGRMFLPDLLHPRPCGDQRHAESQVQRRDPASEQVELVLGSARRRPPTSTAKPITTFPRSTRNHGLPERRISSTSGSWRSISMTTATSATWRNYGHRGRQGHRSSSAARPAPAAPDYGFLSADPEAAPRAPRSASDLGSRADSLA